MLLENLITEEIEEYIIERKGLFDVEIKNLRNDSRTIEEGSLFIAIKGFNDDGLKYLDQAIEKGATAAIVHEEANLENINIPVIKVREIRKVAAYISRTLYKDPTRRIPVIGITGSKGKTTSSFVLTKILRKQGYIVGNIGTNGVFLNEDKFGETNNTTPEAFEINEILHNMIIKGANIAVLELSSQSIVADRIIGMHFEYTTFTNFSHDHISESEHATMEEYFDAKVQITDYAPVVVLNMDDENVSKVKSLLEHKKYITYGQSRDNDIIIDFNDIHYTAKGTDFSLEYEGEKRHFKTSMIGEIAVYNIACAIAIANELHIEDDIIRSAIEDIYIDGRMNFIENDLGINIVIDYAHTEESLKQALKIFKYISKDNKVIALWGLSGQRDKGKRPIMGRVSGEYADFTIITSEDPRDEDPMIIAEEIAVGVREAGGEYLIENDRKKAIFDALNMAKPGDTVALLGKGTERTQQFKDKEVYFNEYEIVDEYLKKN